MSSTASTEDSLSSESDNESFPDINKLKPYDLEPEIASSELSSSSSGDNISSSDSENDDDTRIGNTSWCLCGKCLSMSTYNVYSLCCRDTNEIPDDYFEGNYNT